MKTIQISVPKFAMLKGISRQAVVQQLRRGNLYPEILGFKKIGGVYILHVLKSWHDGLVE
jgi:hypothetical protein